MSEEQNSLIYRYHLPFAGELQDLLEQPYITASILKKLMQRRGVFVTSQEKSVMISYLKMSLLRPDEFDYLMEIELTNDARRTVVIDPTSLNCFSRFSPLTTTIRPS